VQGINRYYALLLCADQKIRLIKKLDTEMVLAEADFHWDWNTEYKLALEVEGNQLRGWVNGEQQFNVTDAHETLSAGGVALVVEDGSLMTNAVSVEAI
jgi:hypothetical protein